LFSLKIKDFTFKKNALQIVFLSWCVLLLFFFQYLAIPLVIITYVLLSLINNKFLKK
jgi:CDP-diacylglycerol--serine O-phosphatidyltransferase